MHVLINAASANMGGATTYLENVLRWLPQLAPEHRFTVYLPEKSKVRMSSVVDSGKVQLEVYPHADTGGFARLYFDQVTIPRMVRAHDADVLFSSTGFGTFLSGCPEVLLVRNPVYFSAAFESKYRELGRSLARNRLRRWHSLLSINRADVVLFPTQAMQTMVERYVNLDRKPTRVIHYGFDPERFWHGEELPGSRLQRVQEWRKDGYKIILNVSTYAVHKNFETLIRALPHVSGECSKIKLLTTTSREDTSDTREYDRLKKFARDHGIEDMWAEMGYVPYQELHTLYDVSDVYVFPSFTESFGHSLVEAMAAGLPIVAADMPVNREVCGNTARYFDVFDPEECAQLIRNVLQNGRSSSLTDASATRARQFSWSKYVQSLVCTLEGLNNTKGASHLSLGGHR